MLFVPRHELASSQFMYFRSICASMELCAAASQNLVAEKAEQTSKSIFGVKNGTNERLDAYKFAVIEKFSLEAVFVPVSSIFFCGSCSLYT